MSGATVKHFVIVRFFERKIAGYIHDIFDVDFVTERVILAKKNLLSSLENQTNKNFEIIFLVNDKYLTDEKYGFIFTELQDGITVPIKLMKSNTVKQRIRDAFNDCDFVVQSRIDYDDFVYKDAVADTQAKVDNCKDILFYGYCKGYTYFNGDLYTFPVPHYSSNGQMSVFQSCILESSFGKKIPYIGVLSFMHTKVKPDLKNFLEKNGFEFRDDMYRKNVSANAFIWFRHDATWSNRGNPFVELPKSITRNGVIIDTDITKKQLEDDFAFHYDLNSIK